jgi:hypothetical protein
MRQAGRQAGRQAVPGKRKPPSTKTPAMNSTPIHSKSIALPNKPMSAFSLVLSFESVGLVAPEAGSTSLLRIWEQVAGILHLTPIFLKARMSFWLLRLLFPSRSCDSSHLQKSLHQLRASCRTEAFTPDPSTPSSSVDSSCILRCCRPTSGRSCSRIP